MSTVFTQTEPLGLPLFDAYLALESLYPHKFLYLDREGRQRLAGFGSLLRTDEWQAPEYESSGDLRRPPISFAVAPFDPLDTRPLNPRFEALGGQSFVVPEVVLIEKPGQTYVQINSWSPIEEHDFDEIRARAAEGWGGVEARDAELPFVRESHDHAQWSRDVADALSRIRSGAIDKVVLARQVPVTARARFSSRQMLLNLMAAKARGTTFLYETDGTFFIGSTPELLVRKQGDAVETMCLAGTIGAGHNPSEQATAAAELLHDAKNRLEHQYVVRHLREALDSMCAKVDVEPDPGIMTLDHVQHLYTQVTARTCNAISVVDLAMLLHPTPALAGYPVDAAKSAIRDIESFNRGLYGGLVGYADFEGNGEFSVAIRSGVFDADGGYLYAGCGIVEGSEPEAEYQESEAKLMTMMGALRGASGE